MKALGVIGGTGMERLQGLEVTASHPMDTPFGAPSAPVQEGRLGAARLYFLHRHGAPHAIPPHRVNYRANIWALRELGVEDVIAINAVGGITADMHTGGLVVPDQLIDYTWGREHTFDEGLDGSGLQHVDFSHPYDGELRLALLAAAHAARVPVHEAGVYGVTQGPRLETVLEVDRMEQDGCDIVGMTAMPEAALARELGLAYASICMVVNAAAGRGTEPISLEAMGAILEREGVLVRRLLGAFIEARYSA